MNINVVNKYKHKPTKNDIYIGRGSALGNPFTHLDSSLFSVKKVATREQAISEYAKYLKAEIKKGNMGIIKELNKIGNQVLKGNEVNLVCYCKPQACHGDVIREVTLTKLKELGNG